MVKEGERGPKAPRVHEAADLGGEGVRVLGVRPELRLARAGSGRGRGVGVGEGAGRWSHGLERLEMFGMEKGGGGQKMGMVQGGERGGGRGHGHGHGECRVLEGRKELWMDRRRCL